MSKNERDSKQNQKKRSNKKRRGSYTPDKIEYFKSIQGTSYRIRTTYVDGEKKMYVKWDVESGE